MTTEDRPSGQTYRARALKVWEELRLRLDELKGLERDLKWRTGKDLHERMRVDEVSGAIEHLEQAMVALYMASQE